jgi:hypothetical protein
MQCFGAEMDFRSADTRVDCFVFRRHKSPSGRAGCTADRFFWMLD